MRDASGVEVVYAPKQRHEWQMVEENEAAYPDGVFAGKAQRNQKDTLSCIRREHGRHPDHSERAFLRS